MSVFSRLTWLQRITLILFVIVVTNAVLVSTTGYSILGGDLFVFLFFLAFLILFAFTCILPLFRKLLWRVRNRLFVTYVLVGAVPIFLLLLFVDIGFYLVLGQTTNYLAHAEIDRRLEQLHTSAEQLAQDVSAGRGRSGAIAPAEQAIIRTDSRTTSNFPTWSKPGFRGIVKNDEGERFLASHGVAGTGERSVEVFAYQAVTNKLLAQLLPGLASVSLIEGSQFQVGIMRRDQSPNVKVLLDSEEVAPAPASRGFWDPDLETAFPLIVYSMNEGRRQEEVLAVYSHPSAVLARLFSALASYAQLLAFFLLVIAITFLVVEIVAVIFSVRLTRTLTRAVHDLYLGTKKVEGGDFSHRIPIRTKDQLSELAASFNGMTERIAKLISEVKEKEKLEAELEIARHVQAQLFPKEVPKLQTLEVAGACNPARVVSGDYYDFITLDPRFTALVIGDISGKGISAALLMASVQSSLHAQLAMGVNGVVSTATLVSRLNRQLYESTPPEKYATFFCGLYDDHNGCLSYTNAGHLAPILIRAGNVIRLESNGMAVGLFPDCPYEQNAIDVQKGDLLMAFTDGITESENAQGEQFGEDRLIDLLIRSCDRPLDEIMRTVVGVVQNWASDLDNQDDTTMLLARRI